MQGTKTDLKGAAARLDKAEAGRLKRAARELRKRLTGLESELAARKRAEQALRGLNQTLEEQVAQHTSILRESEQRYRTLFRQASDAIVVFDPETLHVAEFNNEACRRLGYTRKEFSQLKLSDFEVVETAADIRRHSRQVVDKGLQIFETRHRSRSGEILDVEVHAGPIRIGDRTFIQGFWRDITRPKRAEAQLTELNATLERRVAARTAELTEAHDRLRAITDSALIGILTLDERGLVNTANPAAAVILGYAPEEMTGHNINEFMVAPHQSPAEGFLAHYLEPENQHFPTGSHEVLGRRQDGHVVLLEVAVSSFTRDQHQYFVVMLQDITARKRLERELLEAGERERRRMGHDLHDGLGQQLHAIYYMASVLARKLKKESAGRAQEADRLVRELEHGLEMVRSLARGLQPVSAVPEGLMAALRDLAARTRQLYRVDCRFVCGTTVLVPRHSAANHLYRIAQEAVNNALKHAKPSRIRIMLAGAPDRVILGIRDNGRGIRRNAGRSGGMGLHIMQFRADAICGSLAVQRHPEGGTEVVCTVSRQGLLPQPENHL
jgi:two-component system CheB/CheR fusion protein